MRGYFGVGLEQSSKPMNAGNLFRTAHAFGASFLFTVNASYSVKDAKSDTSMAPRNIPWFDFKSSSDPESVFLERGHFRSNRDVRSLALPGKTRRAAGQCSGEIPPSPGTCSGRSCQTAEESILRPKESLQFQTFCILMQIKFNNF